MFLSTKLRAKVSLITRYDKVSLAPPAGRHGWPGVWRTSINIQKSGCGISGRFGNHREVSTNIRGKPFFPLWIYESFEVSQVDLTAATVHTAGALIQFCFGPNAKHPIKHVTNGAPHKLHARQQVLHRHIRNEIPLIGLNERRQEAWRTVCKLKKLPTRDGTMTFHGTFFTSSVFKRQKSVTR
jgi:hypothetical protein